MPYFITDQSVDCDGWAVVKADGESIGCHDTKESAIDQMIAVSIAEGIEPGGERNLNGERIAVSDLDATLIFNGVRDNRVYDYLQNTDARLFIVTGRLEGDRENTINELENLGIEYDQLIMNPSSDMPSLDYKIATVEKLLETYNIVVAVEDNSDTLTAYRDLGIRAIHPARVEDRQTRAVDLTPPQYMQDAAKQGLELYAQGYGGDGLVDRTIREARDMANGKVTADKWVRIAAWIARHLVDLEAPKNSDPNDPEYPGAGLVAHLLWGSGNSKEKATRAMEYAQSVVKQLEAENERDSVNLKHKEQRMETRHFNGAVTGLEIRADGDGRTFRGYAAIYDSDSAPMGGFTERISPAAFHRSLTSHGWDIKLLANHDPGRVLASTRAKTLKLTSDARGLHAEATLPDSPEGWNMIESIKRGDIDAMSFGFTVQPGGETWSKDGKVRTLTDVKLFEVSIVAWPAYPSTAGTTSVRSIDGLIERAKIESEDVKAAIDALVNGQDLTIEQAEMLKGVIDILVETTEAEEDMHEEEEILDDDVPIEVLLNQLALKMKGI